MNWEFIIKYLPMYERAALLTVKLGLAGVICAIIVGLICAIIQYEKVPVARQIVDTYGKDYEEDLVVEGGAVKQIQGSLTGLKENNKSKKK